MSRLKYLTKTEIKDLWNTLNVKERKMFNNSLTKFRKKSKYALHRICKTCKREWICLGCESKMIEEIGCKQRCILCWSKDRETKIIEHAMISDCYMLEAEEIKILGIL